MKNAENGPHCHDCTTKVPAAKHCKTCVLNLCDDCSKYHQRCVRFVGHRLVDVSQAPQQSFASKRYCSKHTELLKYFCENCQVLVCNDCMVSAQHRKHDILLESEVKEKKINEVKQKLEDIEGFNTTLLQYKKEGEVFKATIEKGDKKSIELVKQVFNEIRVKLAEEEKVVIKRIKTKSNTDSFDKFTADSKKIADTVDYVKSLMNDQKCDDLEIASELDLQLDQLSKDYQLNSSQNNIYNDPHQQQQHYQPQQSYQPQHPHLPHQNYWFLLQQPRQPPPPSQPQQSYQPQQPQSQNNISIFQNKQLKRSLGNLNFEMISSSLEVNPNRNHNIYRSIQDFSNMILNSFS